MLNGTNEGYVSSIAVSYTHLDVYKRQILGFTKKSGVLSEISKSTKIPLVSKFATFYKEADSNQRKMLDINLKADNLYRMIYMNKTSETLPTEFQRQIIIK